MTRNPEGRPRRRPRVRNADERPPTLIQQVEAAAAPAREMAAARFALSVRNALEAAFRAWGREKSDLAKDLGVSVSAVCQVLDGDGNVRVSTIARYARALGYQASLRLDPVEDGAQALDLPVPANVQQSRTKPVWALHNLASANLDIQGVKVWTGNADWRPVLSTPTQIKRHGLYPIHTRAYKQPYASSGSAVS